LCEALKEANASGDNSLIAQVYIGLARMMASRYPALGLSMLRKAEVMYMKAKDHHQLREARLYRADNSWQIYMMYKSTDDGHLFKDEAISIIKSIKPDDFTNEYERHHYVMTKNKISQELGNDIWQDGLE
jgi:hypothetical protein